jgi:hypothetical protein
MIAGSNVITSLLFQMIQERLYHLQSKVIGRQPANFPTTAIRDETEEQLHDIPVAANGRSLQPFLEAEVINEERMYDLSQVHLLHGMSPLIRGDANRSNRWPASWSRSLVIVKYSAVDRAETCPKKVDN